MIQRFLRTLTTNGPSGRVVVSVKNNVQYLLVAAFVLVIASATFGQNADPHCDRLTNPDPLFPLTLEDIAALTEICSNPPSSASFGEEPESANLTGSSSIFFEDFHNNSAGWTLGPQWQIGSATVSGPRNYGNADPGFDTTPTADNGVAGVVIGGNATPVCCHGFYYLTSPVINTSTVSGQVLLNYQRWLNSDYLPFMQNSVEVWNGSAWITIFLTGNSPGVTDSSWQPIQHDVTAYKNANFRVRFGFRIGRGGVYSVSSWNIDDFSIGVPNQSPTISAGGPYSGNEGSAIAMSGASASDPDTGDTLTYSWSVNSALCSFDNAAALSPNLTCTDNGSFTATLSVSDGVNPAVNSNAGVTVNNLDPTAMLGNNGPIDEGGSATVSFSGASDASSVDSTSLHYAFDCGGLSLAAATYAGSGTASSTSCTLADNGSSIVSGKIMDKDGGSYATTTSVTVNNVAPTIAISGGTNVNEGSSYSLTLGTVTDPGMDAVSAYIVHWGDGSSDSYSSGGAKTHTYADGGNSYNVTVDLTDEDGTFLNRANAKSVTVDNVAPTITSLVAGGAVGCGQNSSLTINFSDPALTNDTYRAVVDWGDGNIDTYNSVSSGVIRTHTYALAGIYAVSVTVSDEDGGTSAASTATLTLNYTIVGGGILQPIDQNGTSIFKYKSTIPVKIKYADCNGSNPGTLTVRIMLTQLSGSTPVGEINEPISTSAADTAGYMRFSGGTDSQYIYNLATKPLPDPSATYRITLTVLQTGQIYTVNFGLKP